MENKKKNVKIAIYIAVLVILLGGSFIVYKVAKAAINNASISRITITSIETGSNLDAPLEDQLVTSCNDSGTNCTNSYVASKDSSKDNILVKSFDRIKYSFNFSVRDLDDETNDIVDATVNLKITLNGDDSKYVTFDEDNCDNTGLCIIRNNSSYENTNYSIYLNVNNAPNGYEIHPTFTFDVSENNNDTPIVLGYNTDSDTKYFYSYENGTYSSLGVANYMPTIVSSTNNNVTYTLYPISDSTQSANYDGKDGRFNTYLLGIKMNEPLSGSYYDTNQISFKIAFNQDGQSNPIVKEEWIRLYGLEIIDGIRPVSYNLPYSTSSIGDPSKYIKKPGTLSVTKEGGYYIVTLSNFSPLLTRPTLNANNSNVDGSYIATIAITDFSPRTDSDGQNTINNTITISNSNGIDLASATIQNRASEVGTSEVNNPVSNVNQDYIDVLTSSSWYDDSETTMLSLRNGGSGAVSKGTAIKYKTTFKNKKTSSNTGLKEIIKLDTYAYRVISYSEKEDIDIKIKCGKEECSNISSNDFEVSFVSGTFDYTVNDKIQYELDTPSNKLSSNDLNVANTCQGINLSTLDKDQIQNLYGGPCIKATSNVEEIYPSINEAYKEETSRKVEVPISKIIVQTKEGIILPDQAEVIITVRARVRDVSDLSHNYQATTMILTSDYDEKLYYFAPQINNAISPNSYIKTVYSGTNAIDTYEYIGDSLKIVNYTLRQKISVTNKNSDGTLKTKYRTVNNETITYKVETLLEDNNIASGADDTWFMKYIYVNVIIPKTLTYIPDNDLIKPIEVLEDSDYTYLRYLIITPNDKIKPNMKINDIYFKTKLSPSLSGKSKEIVVTSYPYGENINGEIDTTLISGRRAEFTIYGTGINEVIGTQTIGESGTIIEKNGTINYVLNAYNNIGDDISDYTIVDILPYNGDENNSNFNGTYTVKLTSDVIGLNNIKCTKVIPTNININDDSMWEECSNISNEYIEGITGIKIENISINSNSYMGDIILSLKTKDNKASDRYNNKFIGFTNTTSENSSNIIEASVINRTISGHAFLDSTGDSIKTGSETYISDIPVTLYKLNGDNEFEEIASTVTDENGYYEFKNLDKGRYKLRAKYDISKYDLALRYATEDTNNDSDAYQIDSNGTIEISDKSETSRGIVLLNSVSNMDIGLLPKHTFGFTMSKYITKIELSNNGNVITNNYDNLSTVSLSVINPSKYTTKVYYGIAITNNSNRAGYINLVKEDIPSGFIFDKDYPENEGWFELDGMVGNRSLENVVVSPNETVYLQIVLFLPARDEAGTFINTASVAEITEYNKEAEIEDKEYINSDLYVVGDSLRYGGVNFHVIGVTPDGNEQILTLIADSNISMNHSSTPNVYKWSNSKINNYLNNDWLSLTNIDSSALIPFNICDDASGLFNINAKGGQVEPISCASNIYTSSKVRLLTESEYRSLISNLTDTSFLFNGTFWLMDSVYATETNNTYNAYGVLNDNYDTSTLVKYVNSSTSSVLPVQNTNGFNKNIDVTSNLKVRPVIRISTHNIILE